MEGEPLQPRLEQAQKALQKALDEACGADFKRMNTGELIRIDETLALASKAAKEAVSVRLKLRNTGKATGGQKAASRTTGGSEVRPPDAHRVFDDGVGNEWHAFAVRPSTNTVERASLPNAFRSGWLSFEMGDQVRRLAPIPPDWQELSIPELRALCGQAEAAPKRTSPGTGQAKPKLD